MWGTKGGQSQLGVTSHLQSPDEIELGSEHTFRAELPMTEGPRLRQRKGGVFEDPGDLGCWIFHDWRPLFWVTSRLRSLYTLSPSQSLSPVTVGLTDTVSAPGAWTQPDGLGAVTQPHSFLRKGLGRAPRQEMWQQPWGTEPSPASVTQILLDRAPRPRSGGVLRLG